MAKHNFTGREIIACFVNEQQNKKKKRKQKSRQLKIPFSYRNEEELEKKIINKYLSNKILPVTEE